MRIEEPKILAALPELGAELRRDVSLAELTSLGMGGTTDLLRILQHEAIPTLLKLLDQQGVPHKFLGGGSNLLVVDGERKRRHGGRRGRPGTHGDILREK